MRLVRDCHRPTLSPRQTKYELRKRNHILYLYPGPYVQLTCASRIRRVPGLVMDSRFIACLFTHVGSAQRRGDVAQRLKLP